MDGSNSLDRKKAFLKSAKLGAAKPAPLTFELMLHCLTLLSLN